MKPILSLMALFLAAANPAAGQAGRDARSDGADARTDALLGTHNKATPVPQTNRFSTSPGLEQQAPGLNTKDVPKDPSTPSSPPGRQP